VAREFDGRQSGGEVQVDEVRDSKCVAGGRLLLVRAEMSYERRLCEKVVKADAVGDEKVSGSRR
jgi:hypothetical protein